MSKELFYFINRLGYIFCCIYVYATARLMPFNPSNIRILNDADYFGKTSKYLHSGFCHLIRGILIYAGCTKAEKIGFAQSINNHYLFLKQNAILSFVKSNRHFILYDISRKNNNKKWMCSNLLIDRNEKIGERVFRLFSEIGYTTHRLAFPPNLSNEFNEEIRSHNLKIMKEAIDIADTKKYNGINIARLFSMFMLKRSLMVTYNIIRNSRALIVSK